MKYESHTKITAGRKKKLQMCQSVTNVQLISSTSSSNDCLNIHVLIRYSSFGMVTQLWAGIINTNSRKRLKILLFVKVLKPAVGPAHFPTQRVPAYPSLRKYSNRGMNMSILLYLVPSFSIIETTTSLHHTPSRSAQR